MKKDIILKLASYISYPLLIIIDAKIPISRSGAMYLNGGFPHGEGRLPTGLVPLKKKQKPDFYEPC